MAGNENQKVKLLHIMKLLNDKTDEKHPLTTKNIKDELLKLNPPISAERKSIYKDIDLLMDFGLKINKKKKRSLSYYIGERDFELSELKLLVDAVQSSKFITKEKSKDLIEKIKGLTSEHLAKDLQRQVFIFDRVKAINIDINENVDKLHKAIMENKQVRFKYFEYTIEKKKQHRRGGQDYIVSPYALSWANDNYYLISYYSEHGDGFTHFRVDRMDNIRIEEEERISICGVNVNEEFNIGKYSKQIFCMFSGESEKVWLQFHNSLINVVIDRFGEEITIHKVDKEHFKIRVDVAVSNAFITWLFQFGEKVKILSPDHLVDKMKEMAQKVFNLY